MTTKDYARDHLRYTADPHAADNPRARLFGGSTIRVAVLVILLLSSGARAGQTQESPELPDSLATYRLDGILVPGTTDVDRDSYGSHRIGIAGLTLSASPSTEEIVRLIPSAYIQTNSRGESAVYLRNSGDRQVAVILDGALLTVPWDSRIDLSLIPSSAISEIRTTYGISSASNAVGAFAGAIQMKPHVLSAAGTLAEVDVSGGSAGYRKASVSLHSRAATMDYGTGFDFSKRRGISLPSEDGLNFSQHDPSLRTNTDRRLLSYYGRIGYRTDGGSALRAMFLHVDSEQGVAPEGHLDPEISRVRFWRYPNRTYSFGLVNGETTWSEIGTALRGTFWFGRYSQTIDSYESDAYTEIAGRERSADRTIGSRLTANQSLARGHLVVFMHAFASTHDEKDFVPVGGDELTPRPELTYRQHVGSAGVEYAGFLTTRIRILLGSSWVGASYPLTGNKPEQDSEAGISLTSEVRYSLGRGSVVRFGAGRRLRLPSMRELFGEALGRFLPNPELKPESSVILEAGLSLQRPTFSIESTALFERFYDTIDQRSVLLSGEDRTRRQRVNLEGGRTVGVEVTGRTRVVPGLLFDGHLSWIRARAIDQGRKQPRIEKPELLGLGTVLYNSPSGFAVLAQAVITGRAYGLMADDSVAPLPTSIVFNLRGSYRSSYRGLTTEVYLRANNVTDRLTLPQFGLPGPGRELRAGLLMTFHRNPGRD